MRTTSHHRTRTALAVLVVPLLLLGLLPGTASADVDDRDPERVSAPSGTTDAGRVGAARRAAPASVDADVYAALTSPSLRTYFVAAGHLKLRLKSGSTTRYSGSFTDYAGQRTTSASADASKPDAPTLSITTTNGSFTFRTDASFGSDLWGGTATKVPKKFGFRAGDLTLAATKHSLRTVTYQVALTERFGPVARPFEYTGSMTLAYDGNNRVSGGAVTVVDGKGRTVTNAVRSTGYLSPGGYFYTVVKVDKTTMGISATVTGSTLNGYAVSGSGSRTAVWVVSGTV